MRDIIFTFVTFAIATATAFTKIQHENFFQFAPITTTVAGYPWALFESATQGPNTEAQTQPMNQNEIFATSSSNPSSNSNEIEVVGPETQPGNPLIMETLDGMTSIQCLYDFTGNRVNKGCPIPDRPPICPLGSLVQTIVGADAVEMCCCNYSNFP